MGVVLAIDAGTTGVRTLALDETGAVRAMAYREFPQYFPRPGWVEHDADEIASVLDATLRDVVAAVDSPIATIGITNQRETVVAWDRRSGRPVHRAIVWQDRRTGLVLDPYFSGTKMAWLLADGGVAAGPDLALATVDTWVLWQLTAGAVYATDPSNASRTMLYDIVDRQWSAELAGVLGVPLAALPEVRPSSGRFGVTTGGFGGLPTGVPVSGIAGDQQPALFGQACTAPGMTKNTYGTGSFVLMNVGPDCPEPVDGLLTSVAWELAGGRVDYALEGAIFVTGAAIQWLRDGLGLIGAAAEVGPLAASVPDSGGVLVVPAFTGLGSPYWDPYARGTVLGISRGSTRAHLARGVVEAMTYQTRDVVTAMTAASGHAVTALLVDGGAAVMDLLLQLQADQLGVTVSRPRHQETTAIGAAFLAGLAEGVWPDLDTLAAQWQLDASFEPAADRTAADAAYAQWQRAVDRSRHWAPA